MMNKEKLQQIKDETLPKMSLMNDDHNPKDSTYEKQVLICGDTGCKSSKSDVLEAEMRKILEENNAAEQIDVKRVGCFGLCAAGPIAVVYPSGKFYAALKPEDARRIVEEDLIGGQTVEELIYEDAIDEGVLKSIYDVSFYTKQVKIAHRNCGVVDPDSIEEYIALGGYFSLESVLDRPPIETIELIKASGLRGRGGAGFPTGRKWEYGHREKADQKYVVCNADEGDPGAFMDRSILEGDPYSVIEAMTIAGYAIGATKGYIYIRAEYPTAVKKLKSCIARATELNLLGQNIMGTDFSFQLEVRLGAGAFVCGEESALIASIEGKRGMPTTKPPYPAQKGILGKPTIINNVETFANIPVIIQKGVEWFRSIGTPNSPGTKVFALGGKIKNTGLIEVPMGITLREIIYDIGGGTGSDTEVKAVQTGGPSGGCVPSELFDTPVDFESLREIGTMMGSGGMIVMDENDCMVDIARFFLEFTVDESCGKCTPCRVGNKRLLEIIERITKGEGKIEDLRLLKDLSDSIEYASLCGLGQSAPNPVLSTLRYYKDEYLAHVVDKTCPASVCKDLLRFYIEDTCVGCSLCAKKCPVDCIEGEVRHKHEIVQEDCIKCGTCMDVCPVHCIVKR